MSCEMCCSDHEIATAVGMAASSFARKGKLSLEDKVKSKKYSHSLVKDVVGKGKKWLTVVINGIIYRQFITTLI